MIIPKLSYPQAQELLRKAYAAQIDNDGLRFGQALWNEVPTEVLQWVTSADACFFYETDDQVAYEKFYTYFVEQGLNEYLPGKEEDNG